MISYKRLSIGLTAPLLAMALACVPSQPPEPEKSPEGVTSHAEPAEAPAEAPAAQVATESAEAPAQTPSAPPAAEAAPAEDPYMPTVAGPTSNVGEEGGLLIPSTPEEQKGAYRVDVTSIPPEEGGGSKVEGAFNLHATIKPVEDQPNHWKFQGELTFPTGGYTLGEINHQAMGSGAEGPVYILFIPVALPPTDAVTTQALEKHTLEYSFEAPKNTSFVASFSQL